MALDEILHILFDQLQAAHRFLYKVIQVHEQVDFIDCYKPPRVSASIFLSFCLEPLKYTPRSVYELH